jgi:hypothetical protein
LMAWPRCPSCKLGPVPRVDGASAVDGEEVAVVRSYACLCGWTAWTAEAVIVDRPCSVNVRDKAGSWLLAALRRALGPHLERRISPPAGRPLLR